MKIFFLVSYLCWITRSRTSGYKLQEEISGYQEEIVWQWNRLLVEVIDCPSLEIIKHLLKIGKCHTVSQLQANFR